MEKKWITLTPEYASKLLEHNHPRNRNLSKSTMLTYAEDIKTGKWKSDVSECDQPIVVSDTGLLMQGQHRCWAVKETGIPIKAYAIFGAPETMFDYFDGGLSRKAAQLIKAPNATRVSAIALAIYAIDNGTLSLKSCILGKMSIKNGTNYKPSRTMQIETYKTRQDEIDNLIELAKPIKAATHYQITSIAIALYIIQFVHNDFFIEDFSADFKDDAQKSAAAKTLIKFSFNQVVKHIRTTRTDEVSYILSAYDSFSEADDVKIFNKYKQALERYDKLTRDERKARTKED